MPKPLLIVKNIYREKPGLLENILQEQGISYQIIDLEEGNIFPAPQNYSAIVVLGGPDSANDHNEKMKQELQRVHETISLNIPYLGICLGLQVLVKAAGGKVIRNPIKEIGFIDPAGNNFSVELTAAGKKDPLFKGLKDAFKVFQLHGETVEITKEMTLLAFGKYCRNQIIKVGTNAYGIQCHFELTPEMFECWINEDEALLKLNKNELRQNFKAIETEYNQVGRQLLNNFLEIAGFPG